jgi:RNA polymerase sigma factor (sigma-70 family)
MAEWPVSDRSDPLPRPEQGGSAYRGPGRSPMEVASHASPDPEAEASAALSRGDREGALSILMEAYGPGLYRYCRHLVGDDALAEDVHQTTFVQAFEGLEGFSGRSMLRTWLFGIARHRCWDALKATRRRRARFEGTDRLPDAPEAAPNPEERVALSDRARRLERCLADLAPRVRAAVLLRFQEGFSYREMASICRERAATLQARVARALPVLRRCLEQSGITL